MQLLQLKIFRDIASENSFVKAAQKNFVTQPSISTHLKQLEAELGVKLFDRAPRRVVLTPEGKMLLPYAEEILTLCENFCALPVNMKKSPKGEIRIASIHSIGMYELDSFLKDFMRQYPKIRIHLEYQEAYAIYDLILKKKVHIGMVAYPQKRPKIQVLPYGVDELALIVPTDHPLTQKRSVSLSAISGEPFISFDENTPTREQIDKLLKKNNIQVQMQITSNNIYALKKAVEAGLGISIVPWPTVESEVQKGVLQRIRVREIEICRPLALLTLKKQIINQVTKLFIDSFMNHNLPQRKI